MSYNYTSCATSAGGGLLGPSLASACSASTFFFFMSLFDTLIRANKKISGICDRVVPIEKPDTKYDFIVIGGGAAGSVVAARLSENPEWKVLLLEAGPDEPAGTEVPGFTTTYLGTNITWDFKTTNESNACLSTNGSCTWPSGKNLGGNTAHNAMIYLRGNPKDYNNWADQGNEGWTWEEVKPSFIKSEDNGEIDRVESVHHGTGGPLPVESFPYVPSMVNSILNAADEVGFGTSEDLNGDKKTGFSTTQATIKKGVRASAASAFLRPVRNRKNLHISLNSYVTKLLIENDRVFGVEYYKNGERKTVHVGREVVVSAGTVNSPQILLLSGIGPKEHLESVGIKVFKDLPGVGENLQDHPCVVLSFTVNEPDIYDNDWAVAAEYLKYQTGPLSSVGSSNTIGLISTNSTSPDFPDLELYIAGYLTSCAPGQVGALKSTGKRTMLVAVSYLHPKSRGRITLASNDPNKLPIIWANYLDDLEDVNQIVNGVRLMEALIDTDALRPYNFTYIDTTLGACSNYEFSSDEYWACVARQANYALYHQTGTCKMGPSSDPMAVVNPRLQVHGIKGLRVADASIMPEVPSGNIAAPTMMIGERVADFIKEDWAKSIRKHNNQRTTLYREINKSGRQY